MDKRDWDDFNFESRVVYPRDDITEAVFDWIEEVERGE